jgi:hypothetical protein
MEVTPSAHSAIQNVILIIFRTNNKHSMNRPDVKETDRIYFVKQWNKIPVSIGPYDRQHLQRVQELGTQFQTYLRDLLQSNSSPGLIQDIQHRLERLAEAEQYFIQAVLERVTQPQDIPRPTLSRQRRARSPSLQRRKKTRRSSSPRLDTIHEIHESQNLPQMEWEPNPVESKGIKRTSLTPNEPGVRDPTMFNRLNMNRFNQLLPEESKEDVCGICIDSLSLNPVVRLLPCTHIFHETCWNRWYPISSGACPRCKTTVSFIRRV